MKLSDINSSRAQKFIQENLHIPIEELLLSAKKYPDLNIPLLVSQIEGKNKAEKKLPTWFQSNEIVYPVKLSMEQCSSETTAIYKSSIVKGSTLIDLTGGFGVDSAAFAGKMDKVIYVERNAELSHIASHNFKILGKNNVEVINKNSEDFVADYSQTADWIFIDPARRKEGSKVFRFQDCEPDLLKLQEALFKISDNILIKTSPLLDIDQAVKELGHVKEIHVLAVDNDCKELLFVLNKEIENSDPEIIAVNIRKENIKDEFRFNRKTEDKAEVKFDLPQKYLYEPNAAILKAGAFKSIAVAKGLSKLHPSSHLYTSEEHLTDFPGRAFFLLKIMKYSKKEILAEIPEGKANITTRNFPDTVEGIRKKTGLKDGGNNYLFATKDMYDKPVVLLTKKIN